MDYLQLCQGVARESGTFSGTVPTTVAGQTGRLAKVVEWTAEAWVQIQEMNRQWRFMRAETTGGLTAGTGRYTPSSFSIDTDFSEWITDDPVLLYRPWSLYLTATGVSDEGPIVEIPYDVWFNRYGRGSQDNNRPVEYAISPSNEACFGPIPNDAYTVRFPYRRAPQVLAADGDVPICPAHHHRIIIWWALELLGQHDEAQVPIASAVVNKRRYLTALQREQLPRPFIAAPPIA